ncbi:MAG: PAS domain-containing sensor histidine kinase, partial [Aquabacterium sp.]|nr:PAS domain-containing sensor histidine kinase [Aquabacterium sp.]
MAFPSPHHVPNSPSSPPKADTPNRLFWRWWRKQSPSQQDRYATLGPLVSVLLFLVVIIAAFWYLRNEELEREQESVKRDTEVVQQQLRLRLIENQEHLQRLARDVNFKAISAEQFMLQASDFVRPRPEILSISWLQADAKVKAARTTLT